MTTRTTPNGDRIVRCPACGQDSTYVWTVDAENKVANVPVHVVQIADGTAVIDKGLEAGQRVVIDGQYKLKPGATIVEPPREASTIIAQPWK